MEELTRVNRAQAIHAQIMAAGKLVASNLIEMCRQLKTMRDEKLYLEFGRESFDEYANEDVGIGARQAYTYIGVYEKLPADLIEKYAASGITKLSLLTQISAPERSEFAANADMANITVKELQALIDEKNGIAEQLSLFAEKEDTEKAALEKAKQEAIALREELERMKAEPVEAKVKEEDTENKIKKAVDDALAEAKQAAQVREKELLEAAEEVRAKAEKAVKDAKAARESADRMVEEAKKEAVDKAKAELDEAVRAVKENAARQLAAAEEKLKSKTAVTGDKELAEFAVLMKQVQAAALRMREIIRGKPEDADKLTKAMEALQGVFS